MLLSQYRLIQLLIKIPPALWATAADILHTPHEHYYFPPFLYSGKKRLFLLTSQLHNLQLLFSL